MVSISWHRAADRRNARLKRNGITLAVCHQAIAWLGVAHGGSAHMLSTVAKCGARIAIGEQKCAETDS